MRSIWVRLGIIGVIVVGIFVARPFLSGNAGNLSVGDCFDLPTTETETVEDVQHHPCTDMHDAEVISVADYSPVGTSYPTDTEFKTFFDATCVPAFNTYTGLDFASDTTYDMSALTPTPDGWTGGDHTMICYAVRVDHGKMTTSVKKA